MRVVNKHTHTPTEYDFYIGRGSAIGNPFTHKEGTTAEFVVPSREEAVEAFRRYLPELLKRPAARAYLGKIYRAAQTGPVNLVCFCHPKSCHGDVIKEFIESYL